MRFPLAATLVVAVSLPLGLARAAPADDPGPLRGAPLQGKSGVRLVVGHRRPLVLDVDSGRVTIVRGVPSVNHGTIVVGVGGHSAVVLAEPVWRHGQLYAIRGKDAHLSRLGAGMDATPGGDAKSVWLERFIRRSHCTLRQVRLDGRLLRAPRAFRCTWRTSPGGSLGLAVSSSRVIDPLTGRTVFRSPLNRLNRRLAIVAIAGTKVALQDGPGRALTLLDAATGTRRHVEWPDTPGSLFGAAVDVPGRFVALEFGNPSWTGPTGQAYDVWVLDTETAKLTQLPSMPAFVWLKWTSMAWTEAGRLVLLTRDAGRQMVALWRPGETHLQLKTVRLPNPHVASNTFAILR
jgi:hypothetical protein